jgi:hypothetical protein
VGWRLVALGALGSLGAAAGAWGQADNLILSLKPSPALDCLTTTPGAAGQPEYPTHAAEIDTGGRVLVELRFTEADRAPAVKVLESDGGYVDAVRTHVRNLRVPCLAEHGGKAAVLRQEYIFVPDSKRVVQRLPRDADDDARSAMLACVAHLKPGSRPSYPLAAQREELSANVPAELVFTAPDQPPKITAYVTRFTALMGDSIEEWAKGLRMPCHSGAPIDVLYSFVFRMEDDPVPGFNKPLTLRAWLSNVEGVERDPVRFDLNAMGCPFELRLMYLQPNRKNRVAEMDNHNPARRELMQWIERHRLKLAPRMLAAVLGSSATLRIPCGVVDLRPKAAADAPKTSTP